MWNVAVPVYPSPERNASPHTSSCWPKVSNVVANMFALKAEMLKSATVTCTKPEAVAVLPNAQVD